MSKPTDDQKAAVIATVMRRKGMTPDNISGGKGKGKSAPQGFWDDVEEQVKLEGIRWDVQSIKTSIRTDWSRYRDRLGPLVEKRLAAMGDTADNMDIPGEVSEDITSVDAQTTETVSADISEVTAQTANPVIEDISQADAQTTEPVSEDISETDDVTTQETAPLHIPEELTVEIERIAKQVFENMMHKPELTRIVHHEVVDEDLPPEPKAKPSGDKGGRPGTTRKSHRHTITVDDDLWDAFERERKRLGVGSGRMADIVFWRGLGRPKLSFEGTDD